MRFFKLPNTYWSDRRSRLIAKTGPQGHLVDLYLNSCSMGNYIGIFYLNRDQACMDLSMAESDLMDYVQKFIDLGIVKYDEENEIIWIVDAAQHMGQMLAADKRAIGVRADYACVSKNSPLRKEFYAKYAKALTLLDEELCADETTGTDSSLNKAKIGEARLRFDGAVEVLMALRTDNRQLFSENADEYVGADAVSIWKEKGHAEATRIILAAMRSNDLDLRVAMGRKPVASSPLRDI